MKSFVKSKKILVIVALFIGIFSFVLLNNNNKKVEDKTIYKDGIKMLDYNQVQVGDEVIDNSDKITFDAFFLSDEDNDGNAEKYRGKSINVSSSGKLWIELKNLGGETLKDAYIEFRNSNVRIEGAVAKDSDIAETIVSNNITRIPLNEISVGTTKMFYLNVTPNLTNNIKSYNGTNKVVLKGTVVKDDTEVEIEKEVEYEVNFYGTEDSIKGEIERKTVTAPMVEYGSEDTVTVTYNVKVKETKDLMLLKSTNIEAVIGKLNGFDPLSVSLDGNGFTYEYDETTNKLTARREAKVENDRITKQAYSYKEYVSGNSGAQYTSVDSSTGWSKTGNGTYSDPNNISKSNYNKVNEITITVVYPNEASYKTGTATVNLNTWYEAFNNEELTDAVLTSNNTSGILIANYQCDDTKDKVSTVFSKVKINKYTTYVDEESLVDSTNINNAYNGVEAENVRYDIDIAPYIGGYNPRYKIGELKIYDLGNNYINQTLNMKEFERYYSISLSSGVLGYIGQQGNIKVIDADTNEIVHIFDKDNYNQTYIFETDVRSIRLEVSDIDDDEAMRLGVGENHQMFNIKLTKEIDTNYVLNNYTYDEFREWNHIYTTIRTDWTAGEYTSENDTENIADSQGRRVQRVSALFSGGLSRVNFTVKTTDTNNLLEFNIDTGEVTKLYKGYKNGEFLIELPDAILYYEVVEDDIDYEMLEADGHKLLKIKMNGDSATRYNKTFHLNIVPDVRIVNETVYYKIYAYNPVCHDYYTEASDKYDINYNNNTSEKVGYNTASMNLIAPSTVITAAALENYNDKNEVAVSPMIAEVDPVNDNGDAKVSIYVINNSGYGIKDTKVIGKLAFIGNTNQIDGSDLNSEFDVHMTDAGITYPAELDGYVTIYYSESENPTDDITDNNNGWTETPVDFANIKTYMIIIDDYEIANQNDVTFEYNITMPTDTENMFKKAYFTHGVYYKLDTEDGLVSSNVGASKLGITMVRKYNLNIETLRKGTDKKVDLITYEFEDEDGRIRTINPTDSSLEAKDLYVGKTYTLRQKNISNNYEIDSEEKTFEIVNGLNDVLEINTTGIYKSSELNNNVLNLTIENRPRYTVVVNVSDFDTDEFISGAKFKITGKGYESGYTLMSNVNGELTFKNMYLDEMYYIEQVSSPNHQKISNRNAFILGYDETTGDVKFRTYSYPSIGDITATADSASNFTVTSKSTQQITLQSSSTSGSTRSRGYVELDLTNYSNNYTIKFYSTSNRSGSSGLVSSQIGALYIYVTDYLASSINELTASGVPTATSYYQSNLYQNSTFNQSVTTATTSTGDSITIRGGKKYYIYIDQNSNNGSVPMSTIRISVSGGEYLVSDVTSLTHVADLMVQTLDNDINYQQPITRIDVKNKVIPTVTFKIIKKDADTGALLPNALYKLSGPGITDSVLLTTDENGEASYNIFFSYIGDYNTAGYENSSDGYNDYTLKEISAPNGYAVDSKEYKFRLQDNITCPTGETCTQENASHEFNVYYNDTDYAFSETEYDGNNITFNANVYDYPLIKIRKTDNKTGELLPNTMFAIVKANKDNGKEIINDALDANGNLVGDEITIDGVTYHVITTNENGEITLNLEKGQYKLKEVQASSEKYDISKQVYYFGVGESVPYQAEGMNFVKAYSLKDSDNNDILYNDVYKLTNDGGLVITSPLAKYNKDGVQEWEYDGECLGPIEVTFNYPDKESVTYNACARITTVSNVFPTQDGDIFVTGYVKLDFSISNINFVTNLDLPYIRLNSDGTVDDKYKVNIEFDGRKTIDNNYTPEWYNETDNPDEVYYGIVKQPYWTDIQSLSGRVEVNGLDFNRYYLLGHCLYDFAVSSTGEVYILGCYYTIGSFLVKIDNNGNFVNLKNIFEEANAMVINGNNVGIAKIVFDVDGNLLFTSSFGSLGLGKVYVRLKYDTNLNLIYEKPIIFNETDHPYVTSYMRMRSKSKPYLEMKNDGGYYFYSIQSNSRNTNLISNFNNYLNSTLTTDDYFEIEFGQQDVNSLSNYYVLEYDASDKPVNYVNIGRYSIDRVYPDTNPYVIAGICYEDCNYFLDVIPYEDGYLVAAEYDGNYYTGNKVILASGETIKLDYGFIIYKVNKNSRVEWIKQFKDVDEGYMYQASDGTIRLVFRNPRIMKDADDNPLSETAENIYVFEPSAEVLASGPEAYTLNITNKAKEFDVKVKNDEGSIVSVDGQVIDSDEFVSEVVTYDENSENEITITLKPNYVLKSVKLNGKDFTYQVNDDRTITLDKIPNVKENKTIEIETEEGLLSVTVHHYLENTTDRVASDEILIGNPNDYYDALPFVSNLYSLITDEDGNYIMPDNHHMKFNEATGDVIFYYRENNVELNVNYYIDNTEDELAPTIVEKKLLGSSYTTEPLDIDFYRVSRVLGDESGILNQDRTVVTYFYQEVTSTLTIKHLDINTKAEVAPTETREIRLNEQYETSASTDIPVNYRNVSKTTNANDIATTENIEVIYYYDIIPFNVSVDKRIGSITINGENIDVIDSKSTKISANKEDEIIVYYEVELKNNGDIKALFKVEEEDVNNFEIYDLGDFTETNEGYILEVELEPGESKTYRIGYKWNQGKYGISTNEVEIDEVRNELGFDEPDDSDNTSMTAILIEDKDVLGEKDFNPNTSDNIYKSIIIFILSMYGLLFMTFMYMVKKKFER